MLELLNMPLLAQETVGSAPEAFVDSLQRVAARLKLCWVQSHVGG